jgi:hypothetical protein
MSLDWPEPPKPKEVGNIYLKAPEPKKKRGRCKHVAVGQVGPEEVTICPRCKTVCLVEELKK